MKRIILLSYLVSSLSFANTSCLQLTTEKNQVVSICDFNDCDYIALYVNEATDSCFTGDSALLLTNINNRNFDCNDWGIDDATLLNENTISFYFWDLPGNSIQHTINRCVKK